MGNYSECFPYLFFTAADSLAITVSGSGALFTEQLAGCAHEGIERRCDDVFADGNAAVTSAITFKLDIGNRFRIGALAQCVLTIFQNRC